MQALSGIVQTWRLRLAGHMLRLPEDRPAGDVVMNWEPDEQEADHRRRGIRHFWKTYKKWA